MSTFRKWWTGWYCYLFQHRFIVHPLANGRKALNCPRCGLVVPLSYEIQLGPEIVARAIEKIFKEQKEKPQ